MVDFSEDLFTRIVSINFPTGGDWYSVDTFLGNEGEGGSASISIPDFLDPFSMNMGADGFANGSFWDMRTHPTGPIPRSLFNQRFTLERGTVIQGFGVGGYDAGDAHNGSIFFFKIIKGARNGKFTINYTGSGSNHSTGGLTIYNGKTFTYPWAFFGTHDAVFQISGTDLGGTVFKVNIKGRTATAS